MSKKRMSLELHLLLLAISEKAEQEHHGYLSSAISGLTAIYLDNEETFQKIQDTINEGALEILEKMHPELVDETRRRLEIVKQQRAQQAQADQIARDLLNGIDLGE